MAVIAVPLSRFETVAAALRSLGGQARPVEIAQEVRRLFPGPHTDNLLQSVRARIQECSSDSHHWKKKRDLFYSVHGIGGGVWGLRDMDPLNPVNRDGFVDYVETYMAAEGTATLRTHLRRERSKSLIERFKKELKTVACSVCDFDFGKTYGELGCGFIEAHHKIPVARLEPGARTRLEDLAAVCSNCHRMLHRSGRLSIEDLRSRLRR
ncbi:HNH endonuclease [Sphingomonas sp. JC676]|uniref:HNH endonuclease n=1 Tax=Sphingomonas sp. JC676 TaxID=2768065 RepID=UPI0016583385|nr:HNH endonuclease [Sphingomonas sp. JC676]MBC9032991.1 HNH endonuclease [Sphingomonas sp. JC676]